MVDQRGLDASTEVLSASGFVGTDEVRPGDVVATLDPATHHIEYQPVTAVAQEQHDGPAYRLKSEQVDLLVGLGHPLWVRRYDTRAARRYQQPYELLAAGAARSKRLMHQKTGVWRGQEDGSVSLPAAHRTYKRSDTGTVATRTYDGRDFPLLPFARFLGHYLAEGSLNRHQIVIAQNRGDLLDEMSANIAAMGLPPYRPTTGHGCVRTSSTPLRDLLAGCGRSASEKRLPDLVAAWGPTMLREFLSAYAVGDGTTRKGGNHTVIYTASPTMAWQLQVCAVKAGWSANVTVSDRTGTSRTLKTGQTFVVRHPSHVVSLIKTRHHPLVNHCGRVHDGVVPYRGTLTQIEVPNGVVLARRNGLPVFVGGGLGTAPEFSLPV